MPICTKRRLLADDDVLDAAFWRLGAWSVEDLEHGAQTVARLLAAGTPLAEDQPEVARTLATLRRCGDRRDTWSAFAALLVLHADVHGDAPLFWRAGFDVVAAKRNSRAGASKAHLSEFAAMIDEYQRRHPDRKAEQLFDFWASIAGAHPVLADYDAKRDALTYQRGDKLVDVKRDSFRRLFDRVHKRRAAAEKNHEEFADGAPMLSDASLNVVFTPTTDREECHA